MEVDRLITLGVIRPWRRRRPAAASALPVLMYHRIADDEEPGISARRRLCTTAARFQQQMQWLADAGWRGVGVADALEHRTLSDGIRRCAISFDDGFQEIFRTVAPVLRRHGFRATVYLPTAYISRERSSFQSHECLNWAEVRNLHGDGFEFGSHTVTHRRLHELPWDEVVRELTESKSRIETELQRTAAGFSYPYAFPQADGGFVRTLFAALGSIGYRHGVTTMIGRVSTRDNPFGLKRLPISSADDRELFLAKLEGAYDWMAEPQNWAKTVRFAVGGRL
jgi:peptidoglycan/xylan/chitin deacetylase (PgdA/CDA1 family)